MSSTDKINSLLNNTLSEIKLLDENDHEVRFVKESIDRVIRQLNTEYVYLKYIFSSHSEWEYLKLEKKYFNPDDLREIILELPEWSWMKTHYRDYSLSYEICTREEYEEKNGF